MIKIHVISLRNYYRLSSRCNKISYNSSPRLPVCMYHGKEKKAFTIRSLSDGPRRTEISCVSPAQLPFERGIIKV